MAAAEVVKEALWLKGSVNSLGLHQDSIVMFCNRQSAIHLSKN